MSDRHFGIGSDGLILIMDSDVADARMRMFNADGSEGEMCGNGIRCFAKYAIERGIVSQRPEGVDVETLAGVRNIVPTYSGNRITGARVSMGAPILAPDEIPVALEPGAAGPALNHPFAMDGHDLPLSFVSMGNPHAVTFIRNGRLANFPCIPSAPKSNTTNCFPAGSTSR